MPSLRRGTAAAATVPSCISRSARAVSRWIRARGLKPASLRNPRRHDVKSFNFSLAGAQKFIVSPTRARFRLDQRLIFGRASQTLSVGGRMKPERSQNTPTGDPWDSFEPYVQLIRSLLPRATSVALFDIKGDLRWSSETTTGPDLLNVVDDALSTARTAPDSAGQLRVLAGNLPVYLCWLRDEAARLLAVLAVVCRPNGDQDVDARSFSFAYALLRPALECLRRDLMARVAIDELNRTVSALDKDLELLLADGAADHPTADDGADDLKGILQQAVDYLRCATVARIVPAKSIAMFRSRNTERPADMQLVARAHRQLLSMAQMRREPVIINKLAPNSSLGIMPYRILSCPFRSESGRTIGVLALFREDLGEDFVDRDAGLGDILARKAVGIIESSYDALSGLYTRPAFEQRIRGAVADKSGSPRWGGRSL